MLELRRRRRLLFGMLLVLFLTGGYLLKNYSIIEVKPNSNGHETDIIINFILPMRQDSLVSKIVVTPEIPRTQVYSKAKWLDYNTVVLTLEQKGTPQGQLLAYQIESVPTIFPFIKKNVAGEVRPRVPVSLSMKTGDKKISSSGPLLIAFNTPVDAESLRKHLELPAPGQLTPLTITAGDKSYVDYSHWHYTPAKPFKNNMSYRVIVKPGLRSLGGSELDKQQEITFTAAGKSKIVSTYPADEGRGLPLYCPIEINTNRDISTASVQVIDLNNMVKITGETEIEQQKVVFRPSRALLPHGSYKVVFQAQSTDYESLHKYEFTFTTVDMGDKYWADVCLGKNHTVTVYKGDKQIRHMLASGGRPDSPTPTGYYYTQDRGYSFWSPRFGEGASYWVRLAGQILVHSVPKDDRWRTKKDEHDKLGLPASHGCIRLDEKDAQWFYENIPGGTLVIVHR